MTPETIRMPRATRLTPPLEEEDAAWLRGLNDFYARPFAGAINVNSLVARARAIAASIQVFDCGDATTEARRRHEAELDRGANVLEQLHALRDQVLAERLDATLGLTSEERGEVFRHAPAISALIEKLPVSAGFEEAATWMGGQSLPVLQALAKVVFVERRLHDIEELRRRAYHLLDGLVRRSFGS